MKLACCCGAVENIEGKVGHLKSIKDASSGWDFAWDIHNGLEAVWLCPVCLARAHIALVELKSIFKNHKINNINFLPLLKNV